MFLIHLITIIVYLIKILFSLITLLFYLIIILYYLIILTILNFFNNPKLHTSPATLEFKVNTIRNGAYVYISAIFN